ncbi:U4/U6 small nuclear ribonucleoprotein Prp31 [Gracilaria domingensis]|nr:U4/U6 small nuclear ribonucleoprotein Prp31 [Gracilaria domingensis]
MSSLADLFLNDIDSSGEEEDARGNQNTEEELEVDLVVSGNEEKGPVGGEAKSVHRVQGVTHIEEKTEDQMCSLLAEIDRHVESETVLAGLLIRCAPAIAVIDDHVKGLHQSLQKAFAPRFPELETFIFDPIEYAQVAKLSATEQDLSGIDLRSILPSGTAITVQLTASSTTGRLLKDSELQLVYELCEDLFKLDGWRTRLLHHVERNAALIAPNLVAVTEGAVAAKLIGHAGGLKELAQMPASNVKLLGKKRKALQGTSTSTTRIHEGVIHTCPLVTSLPKQYRSKAGDVTAGKAVLAARVDLGHQRMDGSVGQSYRKALEAKFEQWMEPPPARTLKPLPVPGDEAKRKHRGGKRARKEKERLGLTEMRRLANRVAFGVQEQDGELEGEGLGMLGAEGSKSLRVKPKKSTSVTSAAKRRLDKQKKKDVQSEAERLGISGREDVHTGTEIQLAAATSFPTVKPVETSSYFAASTPFYAVKRRRTDTPDPS